MFIEGGSGKDIRSLDTLIGWLEKMPSDGRYKYDDTSCCLLCLYLMAQGVENPHVCADYWAFRGGSYGYRMDEPLPRGWDRLAAGYGCEDWTFGKALLRALELKAKIAAGNEPRRVMYSPFTNARINNRYDELLREYRYDTMIDRRGIVEAPVA